MKLEDANKHNLNDKNNKNNVNKSRRETSENKSNNNNKEIRVDFFGNVIKKKGNHKIFFKNEVEYVKIDSIKDLVKKQSISNMDEPAKCKCACIIF